MNFSLLNSVQEKAVKQQGHVLLTACPGSGKTRVIIEKLAYEISLLDELDKKRIVALTFTIRASEEIFRRLNSKGIKSNKIWSGTLHSFCLEWIIKPYSCYLPRLENGFSIADESYTSSLIVELKEKYNIEGFTDIIFRFNRDGSFEETDKTNLKLLKKYHQILEQKKLIDFDLILLCSFQLLTIQSRIARNLSDLFKLICVDEFQDTQDLLYAIICTIINSNNSKTKLFLVGDTDQAIYASLGGIAKGIEEIKKELNGAPITQLSLSGNYRSNQKIIDFYSNFQTQRIRINAIGVNATENGIVSLNTEVTKEKVVDEVARLIQLNLDNGIPEHEICVLVPQWWLITSISKKLRALLPEVNFDASGLAPMSKNRDNIWYKLSRLILTSPNPKIYSTRYRWAGELRTDFQNLTSLEFNLKYETDRSLLKLINSVSSSETEGIAYLKDCFLQFLSHVNIDNNIFPNLIELHDLFFNNIEKRLNDPDFKFPSDIDSFKSFYREITVVVINTCSGVKGEEFETVISYGLLEGYVPHWNDIFNKTPKQRENVAKKILYVICSRAKNNLHLICEKNRFTKKRNEYKINKEIKELSWVYDLI